MGFHSIGKGDRTDSLVWLDPSYYNSPIGERYLRVDSDSHSERDHFIPELGFRILNQEPIKPSSALKVGQFKSFPNWKGWTSCAGNFCAAHSVPNGILFVVDGRRHGIPWPELGPVFNSPDKEGFVEQVNYPMPGQEFNPTNRNEAWIPRLDVVPTQERFEVERTIALSKSLGLPEAPTWYTWRGHNECPDIHVGWLETQREDQLPWQTAT